MKTVSLLKATAISLSLIGVMPVIAGTSANFVYPTFDETVEFPSKSKAKQKEGAFVNPGNLLMVQPGMTKKQLYTHLDTPHFSEGLFGVKQWNYIFHFRQVGSSEILTCQYRIDFDKKYRVQQTYLDSKQCYDFIVAFDQPQNVTVVPAPTPTPASEREVVQIPRSAAKTYAITFDFDEKVIDSNGMAILGDVKQELSTGQYSEVVITGYTDNVGPNGYNDRLAMERAAQVQTALSPNAGGTPIFIQATRDLEIPTPQGQKERRNRKVQIELFAAPKQPAPRVNR